MTRGSGDVETLYVPLSTGMNESVAERMAPAGVLRSVVNMRIRDGQLVKRGGTTQSSGGSTNVKLTGSAGTTLPYPSFLSRVADVPLVANTEGSVFAYEANLDYFGMQGRMSTAKPVRERNGMALLTPDAGATVLALGESPPAVAVDSAGYVCGCVCDSGGTAYYVWVESPQGDRVYFDEDHSGVYSRSQVVATSTSFVHLVQSGTSIKARTITVGDTVTASAFTTVATMFSASGHWDTSARGSAAGYTTFQKTQFALVYQAGTAQMRLLLLRGAALGAPDDSTNYNLATGALPACSVWMDNTGATTYVWLGFYDAPGSTGVLSYAVYDTVLAGNVLANTTISATGSPDYGAPMFGQWRDRNDLTGPDGSAFMVIRRSDGSTRSLHCGKADTLGAADMTTRVCGVLPLGKPDNAMRVWCLAGHGDPNQLEQRVCLVEPYNSALTTTLTVVLSSPSQPAIPEALSPSGSPHKYRWLSGPAHAVDDADGSTFFAWPSVLTQVEGAAGATQVLVKTAVYEYVTTLEDYSQQCLPVGQSSVVAGQPSEVYAFPQGNPITNVYLAMSECGFLHSPTIVGAISTTAASGPGAGTRAYRAVYEWVDVYGRRHQSPPSQAAFVTTTASNQRPRITVSSLHMTQRSVSIQLGPQIVLYRTPDGGEDYQRVQASSPAYDSSGLVVIDDPALDSEIDSNEFLYTDGGVLDKSLAPSCNFLALAEDRVWCGGLWDRSLVQCSRVLVPGEPVQFSDHGSHQVPLLLGDVCTGLAYMDGSVIAFTNSAVYLVSGEGPNDQGVGGFPPPRIHTSGVGCDDHRSIVQTNAGVLFKSRKGMYLIPRGFGATQYVSAAVRHTLNAFPVCLASAHVDGGVTSDVAGNDLGPGQQSLVQWLMSTGPTTASTTVLTYDMNSGQWFLDQPVLSQHCLGVWPIPVDGARRTALTFARARRLDATVASAPVMDFDSSSASDGATLATGFVAQSLRTGWISPHGLGGWCQVRRVMLIFERGDDPAGAASSVASVTLSVTTDANTPFSKTFSVEQGTSAGPGVSYRELVLPRGTAECTSFQVTVSDSYSAADSIGRGIRPMALAVELTKTGELRTTVPSTERA